MGNHLDNILNKLGFENPNKDIVRSEIEAKNIKFRLKKIMGLDKEFHDLNLIEEELGIKDSELMNEIKKDIKKKIDQEKFSIAKSKSKILSELAKKDPFDRTK